MRRDVGTSGAGHSTCNFSSHSATSSTARNTLATGVYWQRSNHGPGMDWKIGCSVRDTYACYAGAAFCLFTHCDAPRRIVHYHFSFFIFLCRGTFDLIPPLHSFRASFLPTIRYGAMESSFHTLSMESMLYIQTPCRLTSCISQDPKYYTSDPELPRSSYLHAHDRLPLIHLTPSDYTLSISNSQ